MKIKKMILIGIVICLIAGTAACIAGALINRQLSRGNVEQVQLQIEATEHYSEAEITAACDVVKEAFAEYRWCTLYELRYRDDECLYIAEAYADYHGIDIENVIVIRGDFVSGKKGMKRPYILANEHCSDFIWTLVRDSRDAQWHIADAY